MLSRVPCAGQRLQGARVPPGPPQRISRIVRTPFTGQGDLYGQGNATPSSSAQARRVAVQSSSVPDRPSNKDLLTVMFDMGHKMQVVLAVVQGLEHQLQGVEHQLHSVKRQAGRSAKAVGAVTEALARATAYHKGKAYISPAFMCDLPSCAAVVVALNEDIPPESAHGHALFGVVCDRLVNAAIGADHAPFRRCLRAVQQAAQTASKVQEGMAAHADEAEALAIIRKAIESDDFGACSDALSALDVLLGTGELPRKLKALRAYVFPLLQYARAAHVSNDALEKFLREPHPQPSASSSGDSSGSESDGEEHNRGNAFLPEQSNPLLLLLTTTSEEKLGAVEFELDMLGSLTRVSNGNGSVHLRLECTEVKTSRDGVRQISIRAHHLAHLLRVGLAIDPTMHIELTGSVYYMSGIDKGMLVRDDVAVAYQLVLPEVLSHARR